MEFSELLRYVVGIDQKQLSKAASVARGARRPPSLKIGELHSGQV